ncbi:unnamed protein product [Rotaria magnacalcarata]|uniref:RING-type domain-containing protein n=1 Tax=Rotaria magnacalcarata TaxID=392030 RepID=A0A816RCE4_9BILA|nr:unnamed protein product [Rotaria magnacalcarata]CAF1578078.1 unnamed protein product [Rotaria magnacalcarata]CAF1932584.1 unnamed protein product [Rotaria magnacalcarata]CAF1934472.1 unnamed protein product [Rotaria magnacalcarata]CAF2070976.1 unnamed protein product [Rotaria magnacalcarata]
MVHPASIKQDVNSCSNQSNSNRSDLGNYIVVSSTPPIEYSCSEQNLFEEENSSDDNDNNFEYFYDDSNGDVYIRNRLTQKQFNLANFYEQEPYQRSKRCHRKKRARSQIKTKHAKSIKIKSRNKKFYASCRFDKIDLCDSQLHYYECSYSSDTDFESIIYGSLCYDNVVNYRFQDYTINEYNIQNQSQLNDDLITVLLEMQNRDLSSNDYEILLRLDERIQRRTIGKNILDTFSTIDVNVTHLNELCTICMETFILGQQMKSLPCTHRFHLDCIETYLEKFSIQCPLDNLPLI